MQRSDEKKLILKLKHPEQELRELSEALKAISQLGASKEDIQRCRRVTREARASTQVFRAYKRYLRVRISLLERRIQQAEKGKVT